MNAIKAIPTKYKGYLFRSRLEARYAVFFDALGIEWLYEHEGFELPRGIRYLPDFWLPTFDGGIFAEVKPEPFMGPEMEKAILLSRVTKKAIWMCVGSPAHKIWETLWWTKNGVVIAEGIPNANQAEFENRMYSFPGFEERDGSVSEEYQYCLGDTFIRAVEKARSARFEFGEEG